MSSCYILVNWTRREKVCRGGALKHVELMGSVSELAIVTHYLLEHSGDLIGFVDLEYDHWPFPSGSCADLDDYPNVAEAVVRDLLKLQVLIPNPQGPGPWADWEAVYHEVEPRIWAVAQRTAAPFPGEPPPGYVQTNPPPAAPASADDKGPGSPTHQ